MWRRPVSVVLVVVGTTVGAARAGSLDIHPACDGAGFSGRLAEDGVAVGFESCGTPSGGSSRIWKGSGEPLSEVEVDAAAGTIRVMVGGREVDDSWTPEDFEAWRLLLESPEARLVARALSQALAEAGSEDRPRAAAAMASNLTLYEGAPVEPRFSVPNGCLGCCGPACWGCTGCYTRACALHDICVRSFGASSPACNTFLLPAALSAWCCRGIEIRDLC